MKCSFCGENQRQIRRLIAGPGIYICDGCIELYNEIVAEELEDENSPSLELLSTPHEIFDFLWIYIISRGNAKHTPPVAVYNHYRRVRATRCGEDSGMEMTKPNIFLLGPTGIGRTHLACSLARLLKIPLYIADATALAEAGYVGEDIENILLHLIQAAGGDAKEVERGITYIDGIDKISRKGESALIIHDVSGGGVRQTLLKVIGGTVVPVPPQGGRRRPHQNSIEINTSSILFIAAGTFVGIDEVVKARLGQRSTGFGSDLKSMREHGDLYAKVIPDDLHKFGLIPEFIGRLSVVTSIFALNVDDLSRVLTEPKNAILKQYQHLFELDGVELTFTDEVIREIAHMAEKRGTGARSLSILVEQTLAVVMFDLPSCDDVAEIIIGPECVSTGAEPILVPRKVEISQTKSTQVASSDSRQDLSMDWGS